MNILITKADHFKEVIIAEEKVVVGEITSVSDSFIKRLKSEFSHFEFQEDVPDAAPPVDTAAETLRASVPDPNANKTVEKTA